MKTAVIGGDKRMLYAAKAFSDSGAEVAIAGFDRLQSMCDIRIASVGEAVGWADICVLPIRPLTNGALTCPYSAETIPAEEFGRLSADKIVFCGGSQRISEYVTGKVYDYAAREDFLIQNAVLTAQGAVGLTMRIYEDSIRGANALVLGWGRIGKTLSRCLNALGARVTVAARKPSDREWIRLEGMSAVDYSLKEINEYSLIYNTVPAPVLDREKLRRVREDVILIDLASAPGGMDADTANARGLTFVHALGLPGKTAPKAAGRIIKDTIINILKEENGGKDHSGLCDDRLLLHL